MAQLALPLRSSPTATTSTPKKPTPTGACHQRPQRLRAAAAAPPVRQRRLARLLLDRPPRPRSTPQRTSHRRRPPCATGSSPCPGTPRQPQRPTQTAPAAQLALGHGLHHRPGTHPQPAPAHLSRRSARATNRTKPRTPVLHAPKRAGPPTRTSPAATRPQTPIPQTRRWIQA